MLSLFLCALELFVRFLKHHDLCRQLRIAGILLAYCMLIAHVALCVLPCQAFLWSSIQVILLAVSHVMGILHAPMLLA